MKIVLVFQQATKIQIYEKVILFVKTDKRKLLFGNLSVENFSHLRNSFRERKISNIKLILFSTS